MSFWPSAEVPLTRERHLARLAELRQEAVAVGQLSAAVRAEELVGRAMRYYVERRANLNVEHEIAALPQADRRQLAREMIARLQALTAE